MIQEMSLKCCSLFEHINFIYHSAFHYLKSSTMPDYLGDDMRKSKKDPTDKDDDKPFQGMFFVFLMQHWFSLVER